MSGLPDGPGDADAVFHLTTPAEWDLAQQAGQVVPHGFAAEGFVHCSTGAQLAATIDRHFAGHDALVLLRVAEAATAELRWEEGRPGEVFPHLYRPLATSDVAEVVHWRRT